MGKIELTDAGLELIRKHLRESSQDPEVAREILQAAEVLGIPAHELLSFISGGCLQKHSQTQD